MSLNDLFKILHNGAPNFLVSDYHTCTKAADGLLKTLDDQNGEVQNQAIKWSVSSLTANTSILLNVMTASER